MAIDSEPSADANVTMIPSQPNTYLFDASGSSDYTSIHWDLGDGTTSANTYITHYYAEPALTPRH